MQFHLPALAAALLVTVSVQPSFAQDRTKQQQQQVKQDIKAQQKAEEEAQKRQELLDPGSPESRETIGLGAFR